MTEQRRREPVPVHWALAAGLLGNVAVAAVLAWRGWVGAGLPLAANLAFTVAWALWARVRGAGRILALAVAAFLGMVVGLAIPALLFSLAGGQAT